MNDITMLMDKLGAGVAYLQFDEPVIEQRAPWPVLGRVVASPAVAVPVAQAPAQSRAAWAGASLLSRYGKPAAHPRDLTAIFARLERKVS